MHWQILALFAMGGLLIILRIWMIVLEEREAVTEEITKTISALIAIRDFRATQKE